MAVKPWNKLDWDWAQGPEATLLRKRYGKKALLDWVQLIVVMGEFGGSFDLNDEMQMERAKQQMFYGTADNVRRAVERCAECGHIDADALRAFGRAGSERAMRDARAYAARKAWGRDGAESRLDDDDGEVEQ